MTVSIPPYPISKSTVKSIGWPNQVRWLQTAQLAAVPSQTYNKHQTTDR